MQLYASDALAAAIWFIVNVPALVAAVRVSRRAFPDDTRSQLAMHSLVIFWACVIAICVVLGAAGVLYWQALGAVMLCLSLAVNVRLTRQKASPMASPAQPATAHDASWHVTSLWIVWGALAALAGGIVADRLLGFPKNWDDLMYHLPLVDHWLQDGRLYVPGCTEWYNPGNGELLGLWCVAPFSGDFWVGVANLPVVSLLVLATVEFGRELGLAPVLRHAVAVAAIATNVVLIQLTDLQNDLAVAALFAASLAYGARFARSGHRPDLWLAAISLGLLAGVKYYSLGYAAVGGAGVVGLTFLLRGRQAAGRLTLTTIVAALPLAGYWYLRNWCVTGTPVFPLGFSSATDVLESVRPSAIRATFFGNGRADLWLQYIAALRKLSGFFQVIAVVLIPSTAIWLLASSWFFWRDRRDSKTAWLRASLTLLLLGSVCVFGVTPFTVMDEDERKINGAFTVVRYSLCPVLLAMLCSAVVIDDAARAVSSSRRRAATQLFAAIIGWTVVAAGVLQLGIRTREVVDTDTVLIAVNFGLAGLLAAQVVALPAVRRRRGAWVGCAAAVALTVGASVWLSQRWHSGYAANFDHQFTTHAFSQLQDDAKPASIAVADYRYYPFFGSRRQFRAHRPFRILSRDALWSYIAEFRINILAVIRRDPFKYGRYRNLADWVSADAVHFEKVGSGASFDVYHVKESGNRLAAATEKQRFRGAAGRPNSRVNGGPAER